MNTNEAPEGLNETAALADSEVQSDAGVVETEAAREPTPEEAAAAAAAEREAQIARARAVDPMSFLTIGKIHNHHNGFFSRDGQFFVNEEVALIKYRAISNYANVHIAGQVLLNAVAQRTIFTIEDFQKAFNNVSIVITDGASAEKQDLLVRTAMALTKQAWASAERYRRELPALLDRFTLENAETLRIPLTHVNGSVFNGGMDLLFEPSAGRFAQTGGIVLRYSAPADAIDDGQNHYVLLLRDIKPDDQDTGVAVQLYLRDVLMARNMEIERYVSSDVDTILAAIVDEVGNEILANTDAANDADGNTAATSDTVDA